MIAADPTEHADTIDSFGNDPGELSCWFAVRLEQHAGVTGITGLRRGLDRGDRPLTVCIGTVVAVQIDRPGDVDSHAPSFAHRLALRISRSPRLRRRFLGMNIPLGVAEIVYASEPDVAKRAELARADGFDHIDVMLGVDPDDLVLPIGCPTAFPKPAPTWCATPAPPDGEGAWERTVRWWRAAPQALCEPWVGASVNSFERVRSLADEVPGLRFLIDTGHVTGWGGDVAELLPYAGHIQLRDARPGAAQVPPGEGDVDFAGILARLDKLGYRGALSIEYFDLPEHGWRCEDPPAYARALRELVTTLG